MDRHRDLAYGDGPLFFAYVICRKGNQAWLCLQIFNHILSGGERGPGFYAQVVHVGPRPVPKTQVGKRLEDLMYDLYDEPELLESVFRHMAESKARLLKRLQEKKLLFDNRINIYTGSGSLGYTNDPWKKPEEVKLKDMWGFADAQEFSNVSPQMFEQFAIANQKIGLNLFGRACYGCCEPLDHKYEAIYRHMTNIRRLSVSPWSNVEEAAAMIGKKAIFSWKPDPAKICTGFDEKEIRLYLENVAAKTKHCFVEIILKDIRTCANTNEHLVKFIELAREVFQ